MKHLILVFTGLIFLVLSCDTPRIIPIHHESDVLIIKSVTDKVFLHTSYLQTESYGKVACNGLIYLHQGEAIVMDTPVDAMAAKELIRWVESRYAEVSAVIVTHFHVDCLGSLAVFHERSIPSYAYEQTLALAQKDGAIVPQHGFSEPLLLKVGNKTVVSQHFGAGHTYDNIVSYIPSEEVLFGGCLIKQVGAGKGNLADADTAAWPQTVARIKGHYPDLKYVVPGHGKSGGPGLLDYTIALFGKE